MAGNEPVRSQTRAFYILPACYQNLSQSIEVGSHLRQGLRYIGYKEAGEARTGSSFIESFQRFSSWILFSFSKIFITEIFRPTQK